MMQLVEKIDSKISKAFKNGTTTMFEEPRKEPTRWLIMPDNSSTNPRQFNEVLDKTNMRAILLPSEELNQTLNNARAIWPYIA